MAEIAHLEKVIAEENIPELKGVSLDSQTSGPKILWIRNHEPEVYEKTRWFLTSQSYIVLKLTGVASIDISTAGEFLPFFDSISNRWLESMEKHITETDRMPNLYWSHEVVGEVTKEAAQMTGLAEGTPVIAGTTDASAEAISAGLAYVGDLMIMFGSTVFFTQKTEKLISPKKFWATNFLSEGTYAFLGGISAAGSLTRWFRNEFAWPEIQAEEQGGPDAYAALAELAKESPPGANGLIALPYFEGERTPIHDAKAQGVFFGLNLKHTRSDVYRAILESVAYGIRHNVEEMKNEGVSAKRILAVGGGTKNLLWMQIVADVVGISMNIPEQIIGASYGDAFIAGLGVNVFNDYEDIVKWVRMQHVIQPRPENQVIYDEYFKIFKALYPATKPLMHQLSDIKRKGIQ
jgi:xylulokinase